MGCGTSTVMTSAHAPQRKMSFDQLMATEVNLQDFIDWFRKDTSRDTKPGRALLRIICGEGVRTQSLGDLISIMAAKALEEKFDEEMARLAQVAKAADIDGDGEVTEEELRKKYGTTIHVFDEEAARLAQLAKTAGIDGNMTAEELRRKFGSGEEDAAKIKELESKLKNEEHLTEQQRLVLQRDLKAAKASREAKDAAAEAFAAAQRSGGADIDSLTDDEKAKLMVKKHEEALKSVATRQAAQKVEAEQEMAAGLAARKARRQQRQQDSLHRMQHGKVANEELPAMEAMLKEFQEEALKDGKIDADEQEAIDALKAAVTAMQEAAADGLVTADELERIAVAKKEGLRLAAGASSGGLYSTTDVTAST